MAHRTLVSWLLALGALPLTLAACNATGRRGAGAARSVTGIATLPAEAPTEAPAAIADALKETSAAEAETEPGPYARDPRFAALAATWTARVSAAEDRLETMTGLDVRVRGEPRVILAALRDERVPFRITADVAAGRRRSVLRINAEPIVSGAADADRTLLRALATVALLPPVRHEAAPPWFASLAGIVASGDLADRVESIAEGLLAEGFVARVDPGDPAAAEATATAAALLLAERAGATAMRRILVLAADGENPSTLIARQIKDPEGQWQKGENLATLEDIGKITDRVKEVETKYAADLARLNAKLATASEVNSKQFELELKAYEQIWASLVRVRAAFLLHRGLARTDRQVSAEENDDQNYAALLQSLRSFNEIVENQRPFYSPGIWKSITELTDIISHEGATDVGSRSYVVSVPSLEDKTKFRDDKIAGSKNINEAIDGVCEAIRKRIFELGNP